MARTGTGDAEMTGAYETHPATASSHHHRVSRLQSPRPLQANGPTT